MSRPTERIKPILEMLEQAWRENPDQRLGQIIGNAARDPARPRGDDYRDPFNVEDDDVWAGLRAITRGDPYGKDGREPMSMGRSVCRGGG